MRASRCSTQARTAPGFAILTGMTLIPLLLLALLAPPSRGATDPKAAAKAAAAKAAKAAEAAAAKAESIAAAAEGFNVRVIEDQSTGKTTKRTYQIAGSKGNTKVTVETPETPEPPDFDSNHSSSNDLVRFGEDIVIPAGKVIEGDVVAFGGSVTVLGRVKGSCTAIGGSVRVKGNGAVEGDAVSMGGTVSTGDSATVGGSNVSLGSIDAGRFKHWGPWMGAVGLLGTGAWLAQTIFWILLTLLFSWLSLVLFRDRLLYAGRLLTEQFGKSFLYGLLGWIGMVFAVPVGIVALVLFSVLAIVILCITIIGIPVAILVAIAMVLGVMGICVAAGYAIFLGYIEGCMFLGERVFGRRTTLTPLLAIVIGAALLAVLDGLGDLVGTLSFFLFHPIGMLLGIAAGFLLVILSTAGLGALILGKFGTGTAPGMTNQWAFGGGPVPAPAPASPTAAPPPPGPAASPAGVHEPQPVTPRPPPPPPPEGGTSDAP
jgi:hypothetical protein